MYAPTSASQAYKSSAVLTAPPELLVVMLYDGALRFLARASQAMREGRAGAAGHPLRKANAILDELLVTLDHEQGGEVAARLESIYVFCRQTLVKAQLGSDPDKVDQVAGLVRELREAWAEICGS